MKPDTVFKRALNATLQLLGSGEFAAGLPSENQLRTQIGVSRTTVRKVLSELAGRGILIEQGGVKIPGAPCTMTTFIADRKRPREMNMSSSTSWSGCCAWR